MPLSWLNFYLYLLFLILILHSIMYWGFYLVDFKLEKLILNKFFKW